METVNAKDIPKLLAQKIQPLIWQDTPKVNQVMSDLTPLFLEVEKRKAAKLKKDA